MVTPFLQCAWRGLQLLTALLAVRVIWRGVDLPGAALLAAVLLLDSFCLWALRDVERRQAEHEDPELQYGPDLWDRHWFSAESPARYLVLPRALLERMPPEWQVDMVELLEEYRECYPDYPIQGEQYLVQLRAKGRFVEDPLAAVPVNEYLVNSLRAEPLHPWQVVRGAGHEPESASRAGETEPEGSYALQA